MSKNKKKTTRKIKPVKGKTVRKPDTKKPLDEAGEELEFTPYWRRRFREGSVEVEGKLHPEVQAMHDRQANRREKHAAKAKAKGKPETGRETAKPETAKNK